MKTPEQYKKQAEKLIHTIGKMADKLYPIMTELGDSVEIEANNCVVEIKKQKNDEIANEPTLEWYIKRNKEYVEVRKILYKYYQQTSSDCAYPDEVRKIMESINITDNSKEQAIQAGNTRPDVTIDEEKVVKLLVRAKSTFLNPHHYTLKEQEDYIRKDAKTLSSADIWKVGE